MPADFDVTYTAVGVAAALSWFLGRSRPAPGRAYESHRNPTAACHASHIDREWTTRMRRSRMDIASTLGRGPISIVLVVVAGLRLSEDAFSWIVRMGAVI